MNIALKAKHNRKYPPIKSGSTVRVFLKPSTFKKSWHDRWSPETYKVYGIQGRYYLVNGNKQKNAPSSFVTSCYWLIESRIYGVMEI